VSNLGKIRVLLRGKRIGKQTVYPGAAELTGWQTDTMHHQQLRIALLRSLVTIGRRHLARALDQSGGNIDPHSRIVAFCAGRGKAALMPGPLPRKIQSMSRNIPTLLEMIRELVSIPSMSSVVPQLDTGNRAVCERLADWLETLGFTVELQEVDSARDKVNMIATRGSGPGGLVLSGHADTVPFDQSGWNSDPFSLLHRDNRIYGLGTADMKSFLALAVEAAFRSRDFPLVAPLVILATADEESGMAGARSLLAGQRRLGRFALIGEPTSLVPVRAHKGILMEAVHLTGRSGHSSNPALGRSALEGMHQVIAELLHWREELAARHRNADFPVPTPTLNLGSIHGGDNPNRICGSCELSLDLRTIPGMSVAESRSTLRRRLGELATAMDLGISFKALFEGVDAMDTPADSEWVRFCEELAGRPSSAVDFGTEGPFFNALGMQTVVMGPGDIAVAHQPDEYLALDTLEPTLGHLGAMIRRFCAVPEPVPGDGRPCA